MIDWQTTDDVTAALDSEAIVNILDRLLSDHASEATVSVVITSDKHMHQLNQDYRNIDKPTDVLSFELGDELPTEKGLLGEIYISSDTAAHQASEAGRGLVVEVAHLAVHGALHLLGYEHDTDAGYNRMRAEEARYLRTYSPLDLNAQEA